MNSVCLPTPVPGSFRDPSGRVYKFDNRIFRTVAHDFSADFEFVEATGFFDQLVQKGWILPHEKVHPDWFHDVGEDTKYILEVPRLPIVSFPYEWSFSGLKAAALLHLNVHLLALEHGIMLSDASAYNVQFQGGRPVFIDHLSFRRYREGEIWGGHRQFCEQFLNPLLLRAFFGVPHNAWYRGTQEGISTRDLCRLLKWRHFFNPNVLSHVVLQAYFQRMAQNKSGFLGQSKLNAIVFPLVSFRRMLEKLVKWISQLEPEDTEKTVWQDYAKSHSYSSEEAKLKKVFVKEFVDQVKPKMLWDMGCNSGEYSKAALEAGAEYAVGFDFDQGALEATFARSRDENLSLQTMFMDAANPSPNQGWNEEERQGLKARSSIDAVLALAFIHHLSIARNIPLDQLLDWVLDLSPNGIIEFVPKNDPMVQELLCHREDIFPNYTEEFFLQHIASRARLVKTKTVSKSGRLLIWYVRP